MVELAFGNTVMLVTKLNRIPDRRNVGTAELLDSFGKDIINASIQVIAWCTYYIMRLFLSEFYRTLNSTNETWIPNVRFLLINGSCRSNNNRNSTGTR